MKKSLIEEVAENVGVEVDEASRLVDEFVLQLRRRLFEYRGLNGDYIGEKLRFEIGPQAFYHLLGFLDTFSKRYGWEPGSASEYLARIGNRNEWVPYRHQI